MKVNWQKVVVFLSLIYVICLITQTTITIKELTGKVNDDSATVSLTITQSSPIIPPTNPPNDGGGSGGSQQETESEEKKEEKESEKQGDAEEEQKAKEDVLKSIMPAELDLPVIIPEEIDIKKIDTTAPTEEETTTDIIKKGIDNANEEETKEELKKTEDKLKENEAVAAVVSKAIDTYSVTANKTNKSVIVSLIKSKIKVPMDLPQQFTSTKTWQKQQEITRQMDERVLLFHMNRDQKNNRIVLDTTPNKNNGLANSGLKGEQTDESVFDNAFYFDGEHDFIDVPSSKSLNITTNISLELWVKAKPKKEQLFNYPHIISKDGEYELIVDITENGGYPVFLVWNSSKSYAAKANKNILDNSWHHIVTTYNGKEVLIYLDGIKYIGDQFRGQIALSAANLKIGADGWTPDGTHFIKGAVDEISIYNKSLSDPEIKEHYAAGIKELSSTKIKTVKSIYLSMIEIIPKSVAQSSDEIHFISPQPAQILEKDPIVKFYFKVNKGDVKEVRYSINKKVDKNNITTIATYELVEEVDEKYETKAKGLEQPMTTMNMLGIVLFIALVITFLLLAHKLNKGKKQIKKKKTRRKKKSTQSMKLPGEPNQPAQLP